MTICFSLGVVMACGGHGEPGLGDSRSVTDPGDGRPAPTRSPGELGSVVGSLGVAEVTLPTVDARVVERTRVVVVPLGDFPADLVAAVDEALVAEYGVEVEVVESIALPEVAFYPPRKRYRADILLDELHPYADPSGGEVKVLGVTTVDISTTKGKYVDWGVFGLGELGGSACVVSIHRLKRKAHDREHLRFRTVSTAVHEVGHTFGLEHCDEERCVMRDAEGSIANTDGGTGHLAPGCRAKLDASRLAGRTTAP